VEIPLEEENNFIEMLASLPYKNTFTIEAEENALNDCK